MHCKRFSLNAFILWNNESVLQVTMRDSTSYADPGLKMQEHLCFCNCIFFYPTIRARSAS
jgi:hypothetical protein